MGKTIKKNYTITPEEFEMAQQKSRVKFGYINVSGYLRNLIVNDETYKEKLNSLKEFQKFK